MDTDADKSNNLFNELLLKVTVSNRNEHGEAVKSWWPVGLPWGVETDEGVIALFALEESAFHYRLTFINQKLNEGWDSVK